MSAWRDAQTDPPPYGERVLLYMQHTDDSVLLGVHVGMYCVSSVAYLEAPYYEVPSGDGNGYDVAPSHWQPLPEPPETTP